MLARAGAFDVLDPNRRRVFESLDPLVSYSAAIHEQKSSSQVSLFGEAGDDLPEPRLPRCDDWLPAERLAEEFKAIGFYLSGHPLDDYLPALKRKQVLTLDEVAAKAERGPFIGRMAGVVAGRQERKSARGNRFAFAQLSDPTGQFEVTLFSDTLEAAREHLETGSRIIVTVEATMEADQLKLLGRSVAPVDIAIADAGSNGLRIFLGEAGAVSAVRSVLENAREQKIKGACGPVVFTIQTQTDLGEIDVSLDEVYPVTPQIKGALRSLQGVVEVEEV